MRRPGRCEAVYLDYAAVHACKRRQDHWGRHAARFSVPSLTYSGRPLWRTDVTLRWSKWKSISQ